MISERSKNRWPRTSYGIDRAHERGLDERELGVEPDEHGDLRGRDTLVDESSHSPAEVGSLGLVRREHAHLRLGPGRARGHQSLAPSGRGEQPVRQVEHLGTRAVVLDERDDAGTRVAIREPAEVRRRGPRERVDRLVLVADDADVAALPEPELEEASLERGRVLVLVDGEPRVSLVDLLDRRLILLQDVDEVDQDVVEVDETPACLGPLVAAVDAHEQLDRHRRRPHHVGVRRDRGGVGVWREPPRLRPLDLVDEVLGRREAIAAGQVAGQRRDEPPLVRDDLRHRRLVLSRPEMPQLRERSRVERARGRSREAQGTDPLGHLGRGLLGERDEQHPSLVHRAGGRGVGGAMADDPRLARPGTGDDRHGPGDDGDGLTLRVVEAREDVDADDLLVLDVEVGRFVAHRSGTSAVGRPSRKAARSALGGRATVRSASLTISLTVTFAQLPAALACLSRAASRTKVVRMR